MINRFIEWKNVAFVTITLICACTAATVICMLRKKDFYAFCYTGMFGKNMTWISLFLWSFVHYGVLHWILNMLSLASLGSALEQRLGSLCFALLYILSLSKISIAYALIAFWINWNSCIVGCSGVIFALFTYQMCLIGESVSFFGLFLISSWQVPFLMVLVTQIFFSHLNVSFTAHILGVLSGFSSYYGLTHLRIADINFPWQRGLREFCSRHWWTHSSNNAENSSRAEEVVPIRTDASSFPGEGRRLRDEIL